MGNPTDNLPMGQSLAAGANRNSSGIWSLDGDRLSSIKDFDEGPAVVLVPSEDVLVLAVQLPPITSISKRRAALPFAVEGKIAEPLDEVHVALGEMIAADTYLVGIVRHDLMRQWVLRVEAANLPHASIMPDALALPRPADGRWSVDLTHERALVRLPDGTGSAMPPALLEGGWRVAGEPECVAYGDPLPAAMQAASVDLMAGPLAERLVHPALDLRQGPYAAPRRPMNPLWKRIAIIAAAGATAHAGIAIADTMVLQSVAREREAEVRTLAQNLQPGFQIGPDLSASVASITPRGTAAPPGVFIPLLLRTGAVIGGLDTPVAWRAVDFDSTGDSMTIALESDQIAGLQQANAALREAGLNVRRGPVDTAQPRPVTSFVVTAP